MSVLTGKELRIVGFLCNWCSYGGADTAGVARATQPTDLRIIRVPCSGRVNPLFPLKALLSGADGVLVSGCHPRDCHYSAGNFYARRRLELLKEFLPIVGIDPARFHYTWVSASEGPRWKQVVTAFTDRIHKLGPAPKFQDAVPSYEMPDLAPVAPLRNLSCGANPALEDLKKQLKEALSDDHLFCVVGWQKSFDGLHATPLHMRKPEDVDKLIWGPFNVHSTANMIPQLVNDAKAAAMVGVKRGDPIPPAKKIGVVVKGCDGKGLVELLQEKLIDRDAVEIFAMGCNGTVSYDRIIAKIGAGKRIDSVEGNGDTLRVVADGQEYSLSMKDVAQDKCRACTVPNAPVYDHFAGDPVKVSEDAKPEAAAILAYLDGLTLEQRMSFWRGAIERCIRCHACRNACPMCVCREYCVADSREPHWVTQEDTPVNKLFFQLIHALHLAGRCTGCGECNRACPMGIPVGALKLHAARIVRALFDGYQPGTKLEAVPPFLGYEVEEKNIPEHQIEGA
ncbi:MAG: hydrogenase iron-sulfur subunit [Desulfovibrionaceae bacterium]|nr:hydrogenase iron-sulfur subunit [Desulfovibrionaceae bacterium]